MVASNFLAFVPLYLSTAFQVSTAQAAMGGSVWGGGGLTATVSVTVYSCVYGDVGGGAWRWCG